MRCENCGVEGARTKRISRSYGQGAELLVIENIPVTACPHCCETYLDAATLRKIDRIKRQRKKLATRRQVSVAKIA